MAHKKAVTVVNVGYRSTNYWVISAGRSRLLVDLGWPGSMGQLRANLRRMDIPMNEIRYALATHYHIDHAGLAQELKDVGIALLVIDMQLAAIPEMKRWTKAQDNFVDISLHDNEIIGANQSRARLRAIDIEGEILETPGHSADSVSLLLDNGAAFTGDLTHPMLMGDDDQAIVAASWDLLNREGATEIYPGHGPTWPLANGWPRPPHD